jgi:pyrroline-5-carboxylate reductase
LIDHIAFIGAGNMAESLVRGLLRNGHDPVAVTAADPDPGQRERIAGLGAHTEASNNAAIEGAQVVVLAVKPQLLRRVVVDLTLEASQLVISIAAGVPLRGLESWCRPGQPIVRCMPNTPALLGAGITALYANLEVNQAQRERAQSILRAAGKTLWVDEERQLDAVTAVSGSGPAYFFYLMEAMIQAGTRLGLDVETATLLTLETAYGAALMAREGAATPGTLRQNVTSPGGTTARALSILDAGGTSGIILDALTGAATRARELAEEFGQP